MTREKGIESSGAQTLFGFPKLPAIAQFEISRPPVPSTPGHCLLTLIELRGHGLRDQVRGSFHQQRGRLQVVIEGRYVQRCLPQGS